MVTKTVSINSMEKIKTFVDILNGYSGHFDLVSGCCKVNAKSMMGIFSLDISRPLYFNIHDDASAEYVIDAIAPYVVN